MMTPEALARVEIRRNEDGTVDEFVGCGSIHVEQMDTGHWWIGISAGDGNLYHINFHARGRIKINVENEGADDYFTAALAALTPAPMQGEQPDFSSGAQARITAQQEARRKKPTPPPPEPEGEEC